MEQLVPFAVLPEFANWRVRSTAWSLSVSSWTAPPVFSMASKRAVPAVAEGTFSDAVWHWTVPRFMPLVTLRQVISASTCQYLSVKFPSAAGVNVTEATGVVPSFSFTVMEPLPAWASNDFNDSAGRQAQAPMVNPQPVP